MKNKISFLAIIAFALNANYVCASECVGEDCDLAPIEITDFEITETVAPVETVEVIEPARYEIDWTLPEEEIPEVCEYDYNCPFDTPDDCAIWYKKPAYKTSLVPRTPHLNPIRVDEMVYEIYSNKRVTADNEIMAPLMQRYHMLMNASDACCTAGILHKMRQNGADDKEIYEFLKDDANYYALTKRCLVLADEDLISEYSYGVTGQMVADVRNTCLCKNRPWFDGILQPFNDVYELVPRFQRSEFTYTYTDDMQRDVSVSVNNDVQNAIGLLSACPK